MVSALVATALNNYLLLLPDYNGDGKFIQRKGRRQGPGARWTWRQQRGGRWYHSQPDYIMAREVDIKAVERLDLGRDVAANRSSSNAPPRRPPVPNGGASATPSNWSCSS